MESHHRLASHTVRAPSPFLGGVVPTPVDESPDFAALRLRLSSMCAQRGWTYHELAERSGVSRVTLVTIETGASRSRRPDAPSSRGSVESWWRIARAFDVPCQRCSPCSAE